MIARPTHPGVRELATPTAGGLEVEAVLDPEDHRLVVYWRYYRPGERKAVAGVARRDGGYQVKGYPLDGRQASPTVNADLGVHASRAAAERVVELWARAARHDWTNRAVGAVMRTVCARHGCRVSWRRRDREPVGCLHAPEAGQ